MYTSKNIETGFTNHVILIDGIRLSQSSSCQRIDKRALLTAVWQIVAVMVQKILRTDRKATLY